MFVDATAQEHMLQNFVFVVQFSIRNAIDNRHDNGPEYLSYFGASGN